MNKETLKSFLEEAFAQAKNIAETANQTALFARPSEDKWSAAENLQHLSQSVAQLNNLLAKGKDFMVEKWGKANWQSRPYDEILDLYNQGLKTTFKAFGPFLPVIETGDSVTDLVANFDHLNDQLLAFFENDFTEEQLDTIVIPHPALKALTAREMFYFTALHTKHHASLMVSRLLSVAA